MQPQDPNNQTTNPATPPDSAPEPPTQTPPAPVAATTPIPEPKLEETSGPAPTAPLVKKIPSKALIAGILGAIILVAAGVSVYFLYFSGIKLATYTGQNFSIQYPDGYEQKVADEGSVTFVEKGSADTASEVAVVYTAFPETLDQEQVDVYRKAIKEQLQTDAGEITGEEVQLKDPKVEDVKYKGQDAIQMTAKIAKDGADVGNAKFIAVFDTEKFFMVVVRTHISDPGVTAATDKIINSFTIKN
jgi:hypothetical protein